MKKFRKTQSALNLPTLTLEGGLFLPDQLEKAALGSSQWQSEADYGTPKGLKLKDDYSRAFQIACAQWKHFASQLERSDIDAEKLTRTFVQELLHDVLGYTNLQFCPGVLVSERHYPVNMLSGNVPIVVAPHTLALSDIDARFAIAGSGTRKKSAFMLMQELLNASTDHLWGIVSNGKTLRLLRDTATLTRPSYLEIDLADLLGGQRYAEFSNVWRLLHASRAAGSPNECIWERWRIAGQDEGTRVRDGLRSGVTDALLILGEGFIQHSANEALREQLHLGNLSKDVYFQQLLRLIYRLIFIFSVEERGLLHPKDDSDSARSARRAYSEGYALSRLRDLCLQRRARNRFDDQWQSIRIIFKGLSEGETRLALPALGGLFASNQCPALDSANLDNAHLLAAIYKLRWASHVVGKSGTVLAPVDYRNMGPEELGSVYESLLELVPEIDLPARKFGFVGLTSEGSTSGNARKLSGSYYTPDSLVQELIKSALDPVIEQRLADKPESPIEAILSIRVVDPACGSGHFLLAAARRLAEKLAQLRAAATNDGSEQSEQDFRHALREVISRCIYGVDRNPMAIELARTALWLEGFEEGRPLGFLDHHLQVGDALLGLTDLKALEMGIAKDAYKPLSGDDKEICKLLASENAIALKDLSKKRNAKAFGQFDVASQFTTGLAELQIIEELPEETTEQILLKESAYLTFLEKVKTNRLSQAANVLVGAYLLTKNEKTIKEIPTSGTLYLALSGDDFLDEQLLALEAAQSICSSARVLHWPLAFPQVFASGGFDCVLGNPPWERIKLQEEEFFATRNRDIAAAKNKAERSQRIQWLAEGMLAKHLFPHHEHTPHECEAELRLYAEFISTRRSAEATSVFVHVKGNEGGRYPLTGIGDVNTYALFAETISNITHITGRAGFIVPTGIATDESTKAFFGDITQQGRLVSLYDIENREKLFPSVDSRFKFCLLTLGQATAAEFVCFATQVNQLADPRRRFTLTPEEFRLINPNTLTCPIFRSERDAELTKKIYKATPVWVSEFDGLTDNQWGVDIKTRLFHMAEDSHLFVNESSSDATPLMEAKLVHIYDHRWATYYADDQTRDISVDEKKDEGCLVRPRYWVSREELEIRATSLSKEFCDAYRNKNHALLEKLLTECAPRKAGNGGDTLSMARAQIKYNCPKIWLGWRKITNAANERTFVAFLTPFVAVGDSMYVVRLKESIDARLQAALYANWSSLVFDWTVRQKIGGSNLSFYIVKQLPIFQSDRYCDLDLKFIVPRVLELTYTAKDLEAWALDLGYSGQPFEFNPDRRAMLIAELDAYYAMLYGLTRDELCYILDPADIMGEDYPSESFRVLKNKEIKVFGEFRTKRLVLAAWDRLKCGEFC